MCENLLLKDIILFLDQAKAYDRVDWDFLFFTLNKCNFPKTLILCLKSYLASITISIRNPLFNIDPISLSRGLRQGDLLSPILYNITFDIFLRTVNNSISGISNLRQ